MKKITIVMQYLFYPAIVLCAILINLSLFNLVPEAYIPLTSLSAISFAISTSIIFEQIIPYKKEWNKNLGDFWTDAIQTSFIFPLVLKISEASIFYIVAKYSFKFTLPGKFDSLPMLLRLIILVVMAEFIYYWVHRIAHTYKIPWRFHAVHHGADRVYWANSARFNAIESFYNIFFYLIPFALFSSDIKVLTLFYTLTAVTGVLEHVNIDFKGRYLNYIFNTAHLHRWHHSIKIEECNNNYGKILSIWDLVFKTWYLPKNRKVQDVGIRLTRKIPNSIVGQTIYPFSDISKKSL